MNEVLTNCHATYPGKEEFTPSSHIRCCQFKGKENTLQIKTSMTNYVFGIISDVHKNTAYFHCSKDSNPMLSETHIGFVTKNTAK